jgi:hypothetical protein
LDGGKAGAGLEHDPHCRSAAEKDQEILGGRGAAFRNQGGDVVLAENVIYPGQAASWYSLRMPPNRCRRWTSSRDLYLAGDRLWQRV